MIDPAYVHWLCSVPFGITISIIGLIGNFISFFVWRRIIDSKLRTNQSTGIYLMALAIVDSGFLIFFILTDSIRYTNPEINFTYAYASFFSWFGFPLFFMLLVTSLWLVVGITLNRFIMIQYPTKVRIWYTRQRTIGGIVAFIMFSVVINIPHFFNFHPEEKNGTYILAPTEYGKSEGSKNYEFWVHCIFVVLAPWAVIAILNSAIIYKLSQQMKKFRGGSTSEKYKEKKATKKDKQERREQQMTRMLLTVTFSFLILLAWQCVTQCFWMLGYGKVNGNGDTKEWNMVDASFAFAKLGVVINSSINWFFYCFTSTMFRKEMRKMFYKVSSKYANVSMIIRISGSSSMSSSATESTKDVIIENSSA